MSAAVAVGSIGAGGYIIYDYESLPQEMEAVKIAETVPVEEPVEEIAEEPEPVVEEEPEVIEEEEEEPEVVELTLTATSIEKDLKIKVQNQKGKLVTGEVFAVTVQSDKKGSKPSAYEDKDKDGIIYISKIEAGKYTVTLQEIEGYVLRTASIATAVKDKIEYKKVDVAAEVKKESQVNAAAEDTEVKSIPVESVLKDTLPLLESKAAGAAVPKSDVKAPEVKVSDPVKASASGTKSVTLTCESVSAPPQPPEGGGDSQEPEQPKTPDENTAPDPKPAEQTSMLRRTANVAVINGALLGKMKKAVWLAAAQTGENVPQSTVTVSMPEMVQLYESNDAAANSYLIQLSISGDASIIQKVEWSCSDESKVTLSAKEGNEVTLTRKANGSADVAAKIIYRTKGSTAEQELKCRVTVNGAVAATNPSEALKDKNGNPLYLDEKAQTVATVKDFNTRDTFYTAPQYTGWQTIGGKVYYYNENHQAVTGNQVIGGVSYTFSGDGSLSQSAGNRGIDVSKYQGNIDWGAVAASGISFAIIRVGYRGSSTGVLVEDPYFKKNIAGAAKAGIKVGVYFFTQAVTEAEAVEEASMAMSLVSGHRLSYPIFIDTESATNGRANGLSKSSRTAVVNAFCQTVKSGGYKAGVYASKSWYQNQLSAPSLSGYCIWVAQYSANCTYSGKYDMWQNTSKGSVSGIKGNVDMNISYTGY